MISETQLAKTFRDLELNSNSERVGFLRIQEIPSKEPLLLCYNERTRRAGLGFKLGADERISGALPKSTRVEMEEVKDQPTSLLVLSKSHQCDITNFTSIIRDVVKTYEKRKNPTPNGFIAAVKACMDYAKQPPSISYEKQAGLMGELHVLENDLLPYYPAHAAISYWQGPYANAKDFVLPTCCIEVKATSATEQKSFWVSNDDQFVKPEDKPMFLRFITFRENASDSRSIREVVESLSQRLSPTPVVHHFLQAVKKAGYDHQKKDRYKNLVRFSVAENLCYRVTDVFPKLGLHSVQSALGVEFLGAIKYAINVNALSSFAEDREQYLKAMRG